VNNSERHNELKRVSFLIGSWKGSGSVEFETGKRTEFQSQERRNPWRLDFRVQAMDPAYADFYY
jgi:hypothetical protein